MQAASIADLKKALVKLEQGELLDAILRLARFKKDNKELLTYLLFMSADENQYAQYLCQEIDGYFGESPNMHKKTLRKVICWMNKCLRFSGQKETEVRVRIYFCESLRDSDTPFKTNRVMTNLYLGQLKKIDQALSKLHQEIQLDFRLSREELEL